MIDAAKIFRKYEDTEFGKFDRIESPQHPRPDVCAFYFYILFVLALRV